MNDLTIDDLTKGERVFFFIRPNDKMPVCITKVLEAWEDHRGHGFVDLEGLPYEMPVYHVKKIPEGFVNLK